MWNRAELKEQGKIAFKANYWRSVLAAFLLAIFVGGITVYTRSNSSDWDELVKQFSQLSPEAMAVLIGGSITFVIISILIKIFLINPLCVGCYHFFRQNVENAPADLGEVKVGFQNYGRTFLTLLLRDVFLALWTLLLVIPGIVKAYSYRMVPYIMADHPELSPTEVINKSKEMMNGHKFNAFILDLSFLGWFLLGGLTLGLVNVFWTNPYRENTSAALYLALK